MKYLAWSSVWHLRRPAALVIVISLASGALTLSLLAAGYPARATPSQAAKVRYTFRKLDNAKDATFNQLLGINNHGKVVGYFGSGTKGHPNRGYILLPPYHQSDYRNQDFPRSKQTQVTGLNNLGVEVGFYSTMNTADQLNNNFGYYSVNGKQFHQVDFPARHPSTPPVDQLLGVNDSGIAIGFYFDSNGHTHGYVYDIPTHHYLTVKLGIAGVVNETPTGINDSDSSVGFFNTSRGGQRGFLLRNGSRRPLILSVPGADGTLPFGINNFGVVVGLYVKGSQTFGFIWRSRHGFQTISDPLGIGATVVNGINSAGDLVGFYVGKNGTINGSLATP